jgi:flagellar protein FlgJ
VQNLKDYRNHLSPTSAVLCPFIVPIGYHLFTAIADSEKNPNNQEPLMDISSSLPMPHLRKPSLDHPMLVQAKALEASFLSEMLGYAGVGKTPEGFGGGIGEDQFGSFLRDEQARQMVAKGGIGLAEQLFHAMTKGQDHAG